MAFRQRAPPLSVDVTSALLPWQQGDDNQEQQGKKKGIANPDGQALCTPAATLVYQHGVQAPALCSAQPTSAVPTPAHAQAPATYSVSATPVDRPTPELPAARGLSQGMRTAPSTSANQQDGEVDVQQRTHSKHEQLMSPRGEWSSPPGMSLSTPAAQFVSGAANSKPTDASENLLLPPPPPAPGVVQPHFPHRINGTKQVPTLAVQTPGSTPKVVTPSIPATVATPTGDLGVPIDLTTGPIVSKGRPGLRTTRAQRYTGVYGQSGRWRAQFSHGGLVHQLGMYNTAEDAAQAWDRVAWVYRGHQADLNFPELIHDYDTEESKARVHEAMDARMALRKPRGKAALAQAAAVALTTLTHTPPLGTPQAAAPLEANVVRGTALATPRQLAAPAANDGAASDGGKGGGLDGSSQGRKDSHGADRSDPTTITAPRASPSPMNRRRSTTGRRGRSPAKPTGHSPDADHAGGVDPARGVTASGNANPVTPNAAAAVYSSFAQQLAASTGNGPINELQLAALLQQQAALLQQQAAHIQQGLGLPFGLPLQLGGLPSPLMPGAALAALYGAHGLGYGGLQQGGDAGRRKRTRTTPRTRGGVAARGRKRSADTGSESSADEADMQAERTQSKPFVKSEGAQEATPAVSEQRGHQGRSVPTRTASPPAGDKPAGGSTRSGRHSPSPVRAVAEQQLDLLADAAALAQEPAPASGAGLQTKRSVTSEGGVAGAPLGHRSERRTRCTPAHCEQLTAIVRDVRSEPDPKPRRAGSSRRTGAADGSGATDEAASGHAHSSQREGSDSEDDAPVAPAKQTPRSRGLKRGGGDRGGMDHGGPPLWSLAASGLLPGAMLPPHLMSLMGAGLLSPMGFHPAPMRPSGLAGPAGVRGKKARQHEGPGSAASGFNALAAGAGLLHPAAAALLHPGAALGAAGLGAVPGLWAAGFGGYPPALGAATRDEDTGSEEVDDNGAERRGVRGPRGAPAELISQDVQNAASAAWRAAKRQRGD